MKILIQLWNFPRRVGGVVYPFHQNYEDAKSMIMCILFPQPLLPYIKLAENEGEEKLMVRLCRSCFEATNLANVCHLSQIRALCSVRD